MQSNITNVQTNEHNLMSTHPSWRIGDKIFGLNIRHVNMNERQDNITS